MRVVNMRGAAHGRLHGCEMCVCDVGNEGELRAAIRGCTAVIHLAGVVETNKRASIQKTLAFL